jgi:4-amino-4-deoxy-L-arabinose transferase-like glycosyltransferase
LNRQDADNAKHRIPYGLLYTLAVIALSLFAAALVLVLTGRGVGTTSDGVTYVVAARSLISGQGFLTCSGDPLTLFAPLYPTVLASSSAFGTDPLEGARLINAITFGLIVFASGQMFLTYLNSRLFALLATIAVAFSWPLLLASIQALSEPLFTLLCLLFVLQLPVFLRDKSASALILLSAVAGLAWLERYIGVVLVLAGGLAILLLMRDRALWKRVVASLAFGLLASVVPLLWLVRNTTLTGLPTGPRPPSLNNAAEILNVMALWFDPQPKDSAGIVLLVALVSITLVGLVIAARKRSLSAVVPVPPTLFLAVYVAFFVATVQTTNVSIDQRMVSPLYPFVVCVLFALAEGFAGWLNRRLPLSAGTWLVGGLLALWLVLPIQKIAREAQLLADSDDWRGFTADTLRESPVVQWAVISDGDGLYSNWPYPICLHTYRYVGLLPRDEAAKAAQALLATGRDMLTLIVIDTDDRRYKMRFDVSELASDFDIETVMESDDGGVYQLTRRGTSAP